MEVDEAVQTQVSKFQRITCNGSYVTDCSSNPNKLPTQRGNLGLQHQNHLIPVGDDGGGGVGRLNGWPSSRIVRVSRASGGKDRHSKVVTSKGLRDRRIRLSVSTAIEFYDLQDRLGYDQPSKAVEWLIKAASSSIAELPDLQNLSFPGGQKSTGKNTDFEDPNRQTNHWHQQYQQNNNNNSNSNSNSNNNDVLLSKSPACSSASETSKGSGSGLSIARSENRIRARERARGMAAKKEKEKESSSFTDLLTGGITGNSTPTGYSQMPQFNIFAGDNQPHQNHHFSFLQDNFTPVMTSAAAGCGGGGGLTPALNRGTLQSNLLSSLHNHHNLQRFQLPVTMVDGSTPANFPFFIAPTISSGGADHFPASGYDSQLLQLYGGGDGGSRQSDHFKGKSKN